MILTVCSVHGYFLLHNHDSQDMKSWRKVESTWSLMRWHATLHCGPSLQNPTHSPCASPAKCLIPLFILKSGKILFGYITYQQAKLVKIGWDTIGHQTKLSDATVKLYCPVIRLGNSMQAMYLGQTHTPVKWVLLAKGFPVLFEEPKIFDQPRWNVLIVEELRMNRSIWQLRQGGKPIRKLIYFLTKWKTGHHHGQRVNIKKKPGKKWQISSWGTGRWSSL